LSILESLRHELHIAHGLTLMTPSPRGWEAFPTPGALTRTRITWAFSPPAPQVPGVTPGSPLCPWCFGHPFWRGARQWGPLPRPQRCDSGHHVLQHNASFADDFCCATHGDPRSKIAFLGSVTALVLVVTQISVFFPCVFDIMGAHEVLVFKKP
jgi:hypothetical protein